MRLKDLDKHWWESTLPFDKLVDLLCETLLVSLPEGSIVRSDVQDRLKSSPPSRVSYDLAQELAK